MEPELVTNPPFLTVAPPRTAVEVPEWDSVHRQLHFRSDCIKTYTGPAQNQEIILVDFQKRGWPSCIDSPWSGKKGSKWKKKLENAVQRLNDHQHPLTLRFHVCDKGHKICWEEIL